MTVAWGTVYWRKIQWKLLPQNTLRLSEETQVTQDKQNGNRIKQCANVILPSEHQVLPACGRGID